MQASHAGSSRCLWGCVPLGDTQDTGPCLSRFMNSHPLGFRKLLLVGVHESPSLPWYKVAPGSPALPVDPQAWSAESLVPA